MEITIMATDGGPHPPEMWARTTGNHLLSIAATAPDALLREARDLEAALVKVLIRHHTLAQEHERTGLASEGASRLTADIDTSGHVPDALDDVIAAARDTAFAPHFARPEVRAYIERLLHEHFDQSMYIERSWYADANPDQPQSVSFKEQALNGLAVSPPASVEEAA